MTPMNVSIYLSISSIQLIFTHTLLCLSNLNHDATRIQNFWIDATLIYQAPGVCTCYRKNVSLCLGEDNMYIRIYTSPFLCLFCFLLAIILDPCLLDSFAFVFSSLEECHEALLFCLCCFNCLKPVALFLGFGLYLSVSQLFFINRERERFFVFLGA